MRFYKSILIILVFFIMSCKKPGPVQTRLYAEDGMEVLNGSVKEIFSGDSSARMHSYYKYDFDERGDMTSLIEKTVDIITTEGKTDTDIDIDRRKYVVNYDKNGLIKTIKYRVSLSASSLPYTDYSGVMEFDNRGYLATDGDPSDSTGTMYYYQCDNAGFAIKNTWVHRGVALEPDICEYKHSNDHLLIEKTFSEIIMIYKVKYRYKSFDSHHNWTERECRQENLRMKENLNVNVETRKITYY
jgi:hypothetical protein